MLQSRPFRGAGGFWRSGWGILVVLGSWQLLGRDPVGGSFSFMCFVTCSWSLPGALWRPRLLSFTPISALGCSRQQAGCPADVSTCVM